MDPIREAKIEFSKILSEQLGISYDKVFKNIEYPTRDEVGDLALPIPSVSKDRTLLSKEYVDKGQKLIGEIKKSGIYVNAFIDEKNLFKFLFSNFPDNYGIEEAEKKFRIVVEHTSANPIHPLHIGHLRNSILGDTISRMLKIRGHAVNTRFYVNDAGRQVAILALGYMLLGEPELPSNIKADHWFGIIYSITNVLIEIKTIRQELQLINDDEKYREKIKRLDELVGIAAQHQERYPEIFNKLADEINRIEDVEAQIQNIIRQYESKSNDKVVQIIRKIVKYNLAAFEQSLNKLHISFDDYDYESDLLWSGEVNKIVSEALMRSIDYKGTKALNLELSKDEKEELSIPVGLQLPPLVLVRSDGTSLYTTRDIAYTIRKFSSFKADRVINVIAEQQSVPQMQLRASLYLLGYENYAKNLIHYSYGMVNLQGMKMSGRLGRFISLDEIVERVEEVARKKIQEKGGKIDNINEIVNAAIRYVILSVSANKPVTFNVNNVVDFDQNSGPYLQYTYARAYNILSKNYERLDIEKVDLSDIEGDKRKILILIAKFPEVLAKASDEMRPEDLVDFLRRVSDIFNRWYNNERVLQEQDPTKRMTRLFLVKGVERVLFNGLNAIGIKPLEKM
ncbi:arginine--tRNA ligase [Stygiolobus caldivivus]|uniref:Arginine--tRNA ligase n=1 Tax=Stygiolobus caldivivus TaxID=2824673 RepID=A0A8D5U894_9CREN|nr:arginine--tRNA ligase [Stygiolobus caldivivus]BCU71178.1 arginine--tRNA ligase [Stygiolobus caldivivus]